MIWGLNAYGEVNEDVVKILNSKTWKILSILSFFLKNNAESQLPIPLDFLRFLSVLNQELT